jgi:hypothetical protein
MTNAELKEMTHYLESLAAHLEVIVVDGSPSPIFDQHSRAWGHTARLLRPEIHTLNGKVGNVLTGVRHAEHERLIIADDDVRYSPSQLERVVGELNYWDVVRPQNYFCPLPWHARWDSARSLLNRVAGGDWPGTLAVRKSLLTSTRGYDGSVLFENLELVRTVKAVGGQETIPLDLFVRRLPPDAKHFWSQRIRQAYDELARPARLLTWLSVLPTMLVLAARQQWAAIGLGLLGIVGLAEAGRSRAGGARVFPRTCALFAPAWVLERSVCSWIALGMRVVRGGVPYRGGTLSRAATPMSVLERRHEAARAALRRSRGIPVGMANQSGESIHVGH